MQIQSKNYECADTLRAFALPRTIVRFQTTPPQDHFQRAWQALLLDLATFGSDVQTGGYSQLSPLWAQLKLGSKRGSYERNSETVIVRRELSYLEALRSALLNPLEMGGSVTPLPELTFAFPATMTTRFAGIPMLLAIGEKIPSYGFRELGDFRRIVIEQPLLSEGESVTDYLNRLIVHLTSVFAATREQREAVSLAAELVTFTFLRVGYLDNRFRGLVHEVIADFAVANPEVFDALVQDALDYSGHLKPESNQTVLLSPFSQHRSRRLALVRGFVFSSVAAAISLCIGSSSTSDVPSAPRVRPAEKVVKGEAAAQVLPVPGEKKLVNIPVPPEEAEVDILQMKLGIYDLADRLLAQDPKYRWISNLRILSVDEFEGGFATITMQAADGAPLDPFFFLKVSDRQSRWGEPGRPRLVIRIRNTNSFEILASQNRSFVYVRRGFHGLGAPALNEP